MAKHVVYIHLASHEPRELKEQILTLRFVFNELCHRRPLLTVICAVK